MSLNNRSVGIAFALLSVVAVPYVSNMLIEVRLFLARAIGMQPDTQWALLMLVSLAILVQEILIKGRSSGTKRPN